HSRRAPRIPAIDPGVNPLAGGRWNRGIVRGEFTAGAMVSPQGRRAAKESAVLTPSRSPVHALRQRQAWRRLVWRATRRKLIHPAGTIMFRGPDSRVVTRGAGTSARATTY